MLQILQAFGGPGRKVVSFAPTYSMYPEYARDAMTTWVAGRRHEDFTFDLDEARRLVQEHQPSVILLPSPNNPTGTALPHDVIGELCALMDQPGAAGVVVIDEAYAEFRRAGTPSALELLPQHRNLIVTRTMSKAFALAGARLGYLAAAPSCATRCASYGCPTTSRPSPRRSQVRHCGMPRSCWAGSTSCARSATAPWTGWSHRASKSRRATRTSYCSVGSPIVRHSGRSCSTEVC